MANGVNGVVYTHVEHRGYYTHFICGSVAGCTETLLLYPKHKLIFRQQLFGIKTGDAMAQLKSEGIYFLYRGLLPPLLMRMTSRAVMFGTYENFLNILGCQYHHLDMGPTITLCHAQAAFLAGTTEALLCPLERVQTLLQSNAYHSHFRNTFGAFNYVYKVGGIREFYRGLSVIICRNGLSNSLFFTLREPLKAYVITVSHFEALADFVSGAILGASISTLFFPINVIKARMQSSLGIPFVSAFAAARVLWTERGCSLVGFYHGVHLNFSRSLLAWGITNSTFELLRRWLDK